MKSLRQSTLVVILALCSLSPMGWFAHTPACGQEVDAHQALQSLPGNAWYDPQRDDFLPGEIELPQDNPLRKNGYPNQTKPVPEQRGNWNWNWGNWNWNLGANFSQYFSGVVYFLLGLALVLVLGLLSYFALRNYLPSRRAAEGRSKAIRIDAARMVDLPFEVQRGGGDPLSQARRWMLEGKYDEAIIYFYGYLLLALDHSRKIHLQKGKTNRMYLRELNSELRLREITTATMLAFEDSFFGKHPLGRARFQDIWSYLDEFHALLANAELASLPAAGETSAPATSVAPHASSGAIL